MSFWARSVSLALIYLLLPGAAEAAENVVHFATEGVLAHDHHHDEHEHDDGEHGCTATFHACGCCASVVPIAIFAAPIEWSVRLAIVLEQRHREPRAAAGRDAGNELLRPPIA